MNTNLLNHTDATNGIYTSEQTIWWEETFTQQVNNIVITKTVCKKNLEIKNMLNICWM